MEPWRPETWLDYSGHLPFGPAFSANSAEFSCEDNLSDHTLRIDMLSTELAMSERALQRKLRAITGQTPTLYIRTFRLRKALILMRGGTPIDRVAELVGFSSPAYFSSCCRQEFGESPTKFAGMRS